MSIDYAADTVNYRQCYTDADITLYELTGITEYHKSREMAMQAQEKYSNAGISKETLTALADAAIESINNENNRDKLRTDQAALWLNVKARMKEPVDELCALRMGCIATFMKGEPLEYMNDNFTRHKLALAQKNPELYAFFLHRGIAYTPEYVQALRGLTAEDYFQRRSLLLGTMS